MNPNSLKVALKMRELLADPEHWIKGTLAQNEKGRQVNVVSEEACKFCLIGAYSKALCESGIDMFKEAETDFNVWKDLFEPDRSFLPAAFNDDPKTTHSDVMNFLDERIAECSAHNSSAP